MNSLDPLSSLWQQQAEAPRTPPQQVIRKAASHSQREKRELVFAMIALLGTACFFMVQAYLMQEIPLMRVFLIGLAVFLCFATARIYRHSKQFKTPLDLDTKSYLQSLVDQRESSRKMERFIYFVYMPVLATGICAGIWLALTPLPLWIRLAAIGATLLWTLIAGIWGKKRQQKKRARLDGLISQLESHHT